MPRVAKKKENLAQLELDGYPTKLTLEYLQGLSRTQIQAFAKRYGVRANLKTDEIIKQLMVKEEEQNEPKLVRAATRKGKETQKALGPRKTPVDSVPETGAQINESALGPDNAANSEAASTALHDKPRSSRRRAAPYPPAKEREALKRQGSSKETPEVVKSVEEEPLTKPTVKEVRDVQKLLATLNEERVAMQKDMEETKFMLASARRALTVAADKVKLITWRRDLYEREILAKMKSKRTLWDGTAHMAPKDRKTWGDFVDAHWDPSRRPDNELSADKADEEQSRDGDNEMSDDEAPSGQPASQSTAQAMEEVDFDDIYV